MVRREVPFVAVVFFIVSEFLQDLFRLAVDEGGVDLVDVGSGKHVVNFGLHHGPLGILERILLLHQVFLNTNNRKFIY